MENIHPQGRINIDIGNIASEAIVIIKAIACEKDYKFKTVTFFRKKIPGFCELKDVFCETQRNPENDRRPTELRDIDHV
jgi:hypothetical protein